MSDPYLPPNEDKKPTGYINSGVSAVLVSFGKHFVAGTVGGLAECSVSYPLDTVKTKMQTETGFKSPLNCFTTTVREDGARALYRGMSSRLVASMLASSVMFGANGTLKQLFNADPHKPLTARFVAAAGGTGALEALVYCPLELVKTRMQVLRGSKPNVTTLSTGLLVHRQYGMTGLYRGFSSLLFREAFGNCAYFTSYEIGKQTLAGSARERGASVFAVATAGGVAGVLYALVVHPIDTIKSLVQADSLGNPRYHGFGDALKQSVAAGGGGMQGFRSLYRGLSPALARGFVANAVLFLSFETVMDLLSR